MENEKKLKTTINVMGVVIGILVLIIIGLILNMYIPNEQNAETPSAAESYVEETANSEDTAVEIKGTLDPEAYANYIKLLNSKKWDSAHAVLVSYGRIDLEDKDLFKVAYNYGDNEEFCEKILVNHDYSVEKLKKVGLNGKGYAEEVNARCKKYYDAGKCIANQ